MVTFLKIMRWLAIGSILTIGSLVIFLSISDLIFGIKRTFFDIPKANQEYQKSIQDILNINNDVLLQERIDPNVKYASYQGCWIAGGSRVFGTNRSLLDVVTQYGQKLDQMGWMDAFKLSNGPDRKSQTDFNYETNNMHIWIEPYNQKIENDEWNKYHTIYRLIFDFGYPGPVSTCYGS